MGFFDFLHKDEEENKIANSTPAMIKYEEPKFSFGKAFIQGFGNAAVDVGKSLIKDGMKPIKYVANKAIDKVVVPSAEFLNVVDDAASGTQNKYLNRDDGQQVLLQDLPATQQAASAVFHSFKAVGRGVSGTLEGGLRGLQWLGVDGAKPYADKVSEWQAAAAIDTSSVGKGQMFLENLASGLGSAAMFYVPGALVAKGMGAMSAASLFGTYTPRIAMIFGGSVSTALEAMTEAGSSYQEALNSGDSKEVANSKASSVFFANSALIFLTNYLGRFSPETRSQLKTMLLSAPNEAVQEYGQQVIGNVVANREWKEGAAEAGLIGGIIGGLLGADNMAMKTTKTGQEKIVDQQIIKPEAVVTRLNDLALKASLILKGNANAQTQVGNEIIALQESALKNVDSPGKFYREVANIIKSSALSEENKTRLLSVEEGLAGTVKDFYTQLKAEPGLYQSLEEKNATYYTPAEEKEAIKRIGAKLSMPYEQASKTLNILRKLMGKKDKEKEPEMFQEAVNQAKLETGQEPDILKEAISQAQRDVIIPADQIEEPAMDIYHQTNNDVESIKDGGFDFGKNSVFGEAAFFSTKADPTYGQNQIKINTAGLNLKNIDTVREQQEYLSQQNAKTVAGAVRAEGKYDGFSIKQADGTRVVAVTNKEKLDNTLKKQQFISNEEAKKVSKEFAFIEALDIPVIMKEKILTQSGQEAFGRYARPIIEFLSNPHKTTIPHEAVHAFIDLMLTDKQKKSLLSEVKRRYAGKNYTNTQAEERLAQDFARYYTQKKDAGKAAAPSSKIKQFFDKFIEILQKIFAPGNVDKIQKFYRDVETKRPGLIKKQYIKRKMVRGYKSRMALQMEYYLEPNKLTSKFLENVDVKNREFASYQFLSDLLKSKSLPLKDAERDLIGDVLNTQFKDEKKISMQDLRNAIVSELLPLKILESASWSDYGAQEVGRDYNHDHTTYIFNSPFDHGVKGHFGRDYERRIYPEKVEVRQIPGQNKWAIVRTDTTLTEDNIQQNVYHVANTKEAAESWLNQRKEEAKEKGFEDIDLTKVGLFSHARVWDPNQEDVETTNEDEDVRYIAEIQSDAFQNLERITDRAEKFFEYYNTLQQAEKDWDKKEIFIVNDEGDDYAAEEWLEIVSAFESGQKVGYEKTKDTTPEETAFLQYKNTWHERTIRELIRIAAMDGKKRLRFPTPHTISKIEGYLSEDGQIPTGTEVGDTFDYGGEDYVVLKENQAMGEDAATVTPASNIRTTVDYDTVRQEDIDNRLSEMLYELENSKEDQIDIYEIQDDFTNEELLEMRESLINGNRSIIEEKLMPFVEKATDNNYTNNEEYAAYYNDEVFGEETVFPRGDGELIILEKTNNLEVMTYGGASDAGKDSFDYTKLDVQEHRTVNEFYHKKIGRYLMKLKKDHARIVTDHLNFDWVEVDILAEDKEAVEAFQTKDVVENTEPKVFTGEEVAEYTDDITREAEEEGISDYLKDVISSQKFILTKARIKDLLKADKDLRDYVENGEQRYPEGADGIDEPIVVGYWEPTGERQVLDGYNRILSLKERGQSYVDAYVAVEPNLREIHPEDERVMINFIDYARIGKAESVELEVSARRTAEGYGLRPDQTNRRLANSFEKLMAMQPKYQEKSIFRSESGVIEDFVRETGLTARERFVIPNLEKISFGGSDRDVYNLGDYVLKVAKTARGLAQNRLEGEPYAPVPEVIERGENYVVTQFAEKPNQKTKDLVKALQRNKNFNSRTPAVDMINNTAQEYFEAGDEDMGSLIQDLNNYDVMLNDLTAIRNWGTIDGEPVLIDAGTLDTNIIRDYEGKTNLNDQDFNSIYRRSRAAKRMYGDLDNKTKYQTANNIIDEYRVGGNKNTKNVIRKSTGLIVENPKVTTTEKNLLKHKLRNIRRGVIMGRADMRNVMIETFRKRIKDQEEIKKTIIAYAKDLPAGERGRLLPMVAKATTQRDLAKAFMRIDAALQNADKKEQLQEFKDIAAQTKRAMKSGTGIAVDYQKKIMDILSDYNLSRPTDKTFKKLIALRDYLKKEDSNIVPDHLVKQLDKLSRVNVTELDAMTIKNINDLLNRLLALGHLKLQLKNTYDERQRQVSLAKLVDNTKSLDPKGDPREKSFSLLSSAVTTKINILHAFRVTDKMDGNADYRGQNTRLQQNISQKVSNAELTSSATLQAVLGQIKDIKEIWTQDEQAIMELHLLIQQGAQEQAQQLIYKMGWDKLPELTPEMEIAMDLMRGAFSKNEDYLAAVYEELENKPFEKVKNYFPLKYEKKIGEIPEPTIGQKFPRTTKTEQGFTFKRLPGVKRVPRIDVFAQFEEAIREQQYYMQVQPALMETRSLINDPTYKEKAGQIAINWWRDYMDAIANKGSLSRAEHHALLSQVRVNLSRAILGYKLSSILIQPMAIFDAMAYTQSRFGTVAAGKMLAHFTYSWLNPTYAKKIKRLSPAIQLRDGGELAIEEIEAMAKGRGFYKQFQRGSLALLKWADVTTAAAVDQAFYKILRKEGLEEGKARLEADLLMNIVSGSSEIADRPMILMKGEAFKTLFTFQTFVLNRWGIISHDLFSSGIVKGNLDRKLRALLGLIILSIGNAFEEKIRELVLSAVSGKKYKDKLSFWQSALFTVPEAVPVLGQMLSGTLKYNQSFSVPATRTIENFITGVSMLSSDKEETRMKGALKLSENLAILLGVPGTAQGFDIAERLIVPPKNKKKAAPTGMFLDAALPTLPGLPDLPALPSL